MYYRLAAAIVFAIFFLPLGSATGQESVNETASSATVTVKRSKSSNRDAQKAKNDSQNAAILQEIKEIRELMGGGVSKQLEGLYDNMPSSKAGVASQEPKPAHQAGQHDGTSMRLDISGDYVQSELEKLLDNAFDFEINKLTQTETEEEDSVAKVASVLESANVQAQDVDRLRLAAKFLDLAASELEEVSVFEHADELRRQAHLLRVKARKVMR